MGGGTGWRSCGWCGSLLSLCFWYYLKNISTITWWVSRKKEKINQARREGGLLCMIVTGPFDTFLTCDSANKSVKCLTKKCLFSKFTDRTDILWHVGDMSPLFPTKVCSFKSSMTIRGGMISCWNTRDSLSCAAPFVFTGQALDLFLELKIWAHLLPCWDWVLAYMLLIKLCGIGDNSRACGHWCKIFAPGSALIFSSHHAVWCTVLSSWPCATVYPNARQACWNQQQTFVAL